MSCQVPNGKHLYFFANTTTVPSAPGVYDNGWHAKSESNLLRRTLRFDQATGPLGYSQILQTRHLRFGDFRFLVSQGESPLLNSAEQAFLIYVASSRSWSTFCPYPLGTAAAFHGSALSFSSTSICWSVCIGIDLIFSRASIGWSSLRMLGGANLFLTFGHIIWSANSQQEQIKVTRVEWVGRSSLHSICALPRFIQGSFKRPDSDFQQKGSGLNVIVQYSTLDLVETKATRTTVQRWNCSVVRWECRSSVKVVQIMSLFLHSLTWYVHNGYETLTYKI